MEPENPFDATEFGRGKTILSDDYTIELSALFSAVSALHNHPLLDRCEA